MDIFANRKIQSSKSSVCYQVVYAHGNLQHQHHVHWVFQISTSRHDHDNQDINRGLPDWWNPQVEDEYFKVRLSFEQNHQEKTQKLKIY